MRGWLIAFLPLLAGLMSALGEANQPSSDKIASHRDFTEIRREVETLRGKRFLHDVPVYRISKNALRARSSMIAEAPFWVG